MFELENLPQNEDTIEVVVPAIGKKDVNLPANVEQFDIKISFDNSISGRVTSFDGIGKTVTIRVIGLDGSREIVTDVNGYLEIDRLASGSYRLEVDSDFGSANSGTFTIIPGVALEPFNLILRSGRRIQGTIAGLIGQENVEVSVRDGTNRIIRSREFVNGSYSIGGLPNQITVTAKTSIGRIFARRIRFGNRWEAQVDWKFTGSSSLKGSVYVGDRPSSAISLRLTPENRKFPAALLRTSDQGKYKIHGISDGRYLGETRSGHSFTVNIAGETNYDLYLPPNSLRGKVVTRNSSTLINGGWVSITPVGTSLELDQSLIKQSIAIDGTFLFYGLPLGSYDVHIVYPNFKSITRRVDVDGHMFIEVEIESDDRN